MQDDAIKGWVEQRDSLLSEISVATKEKESLEKTNKELTETNGQLVEAIIGNKREAEITESAIEKVKVDADDKKTLINGEIEILQGRKDDLDKSVNTQTQEVENTKKLVETMKEAVQLTTGDFYELLNTVKAITGELLSTMGAIKPILEEIQTTKDSFVQKVVKDVAEIEKQKDQIRQQSQTLMYREAMVRQEIDKIEAWRLINEPMVVSEEEPA